MYVEKSKPGRSADSTCSRIATNTFVLRDVEQKKTEKNLGLSFSFLSSFKIDDNVLLKLVREKYLA